nr:hypothetical protein CFP56_55840 [Quercus suber]
MSVRKLSKDLTSQTTNTPRQPWRREDKKVEVAMVEEPKKATKSKKRKRGSIPPPFTVSTEELCSILEAWLKDGMLVLPKCKYEPMEEEKQGPLYCKYHKRVAKGDLVIKGGKRADPRMRRLEVAMTFFMGCEDPMEEKVENMASSSSHLCLYKMKKWSQEFREGDKEDGEPDPPNLTQQPKEVHVVEEPVKEAPEYINDVVKNVQVELVEIDLNDGEGEEV